MRWQMGEHLVREIEEYTGSETDQLKAIRSHRNRRRAWRHMIRVRRIRGIMLGLVMLVVTALCVVMDSFHDATFALITVPAALWVIRNGL